MKKYLKVAHILILCALVSSCKKNEPKQENIYIYGVAEDGENNKYKTVDINGKIWFTENLSCKLFRNGDTIVEARTKNEWEAALMNGIPAWCYCNNDSLLSEKYGIIYNFHAVRDSRGLAPNGWHISTSNEWQLLINKHGGEWNAGFDLKSTTGWPNNGNGSNSTKFNAFPGGVRTDIGTFMSIEENGYWWTSSKTDYYYDNYLIPGNYSVLLPSINNLVNIHDIGNWGHGMYVRCVKD